MYTRAPRPAAAGLGNLIDELFRPAAQAAGAAAQAELARRTEAANVQVREQVATALAPYTPTLVREYGVPAAQQYVGDLVRRYQTPLLVGGGLLALWLLRPRP